jgi:hypothetical protein
MKNMVQKMKYRVMFLIAQKVDKKLRSGKNGINYIKLSKNMDEVTEVDVYFYIPNKKHTDWSYIDVVNSPYHMKCNNNHKLVRSFLIRKFIADDEYGSVVRKYVTITPELFSDVNLIDVYNSGKFKQFINKYADIIIGIIIGMHNQEYKDVIPGLKYS